jgi:LmbE family N-acetylglucosaminyl deacetylase
VVGAHPDDADFGAGGLVALWASSGCAVTVVCVTDGDSGGFDASVPREQVPGIRQDEQRAAAAALGVDDVRFLGRPDGWVQVDRSLRLDLARVVRDVRPEAVVTHSPDRDYRFVYMYHPDHLATGAAVLAAVYPDARNAFAFPPAELDLPLWEVPQVWLFGGPHGDTAVDVTDVFDAKV